MYDGLMFVKGFLRLSRMRDEKLIRSFCNGRRTDSLSTCHMFFHRTGRRNSRVPLRSCGDKLHIRSICRALSKGMSKCILFLNHKPFLTSKCNYFRYIIAKQKYCSKLIRYTSHHKCYAVICISDTGFISYLIRANFMPYRSISHASSAVVFLG